MLNKETKKRIDAARDILVGQLPLPTDQIEIITLALIYKFMDDQDELLREIGLPAKFFTDELADYGWQNLMSKQIGAEARRDLFADAIRAFEQAKHLPTLFRQIFNNSLLRFRDAKVLSRFLEKINEFQYSHSEELGNAFEYLLQTMGAQGDNGQFRTPRNIIDFIVDVVAPTVTDHILDPACGTGGFLVSAYKHILARHTAGFDDYRPTLNNRTDEQLAGVRWGDLLTAPQKAKLGKNIEGYDITPLMTRLARVNLYLHHFPSPNIQDYDTIGMNTRWGDKFDVILANPPFMTPKGGVEAHDRFRLKSSKKAEVLFSDYILEHLNPDGRAGFIVPEGIVFTNSGDYVTLRKWAINEGGLWAVVSLPAGVFQPYSGVKTTILFIDRGFRRQHDNILLLKVENDGYSLNANRNPITKNDLPLAWEMLTVFRDQPEEFTALYGDADTAPTADVLKFRVVPRADFGRLDAYKATATAKDYLKKAYAALPPLPDLSVRPTNGLADKLDNFRRLTGWPVTLLPTDENELMEWFNREVKEAAIAYGARLQEEMILGVGVKEELEKKREYSLSLDHQTRNDFQKQSAFEVVTVRDLCLSIVSGGTPSTESPDFWNGHIPWITSADIQDIRTITPRKFITEKGLKNSATSLIPAHNIIVVTRVSLGKMAINKFDICTSQDSMGLIVDKSKILVDYLAYILLEEVQKFKEIGKGVTIRGVSKNDLEEIQIPRPPLSIQQQIVDEISGYQKVIDGCRLLVENYRPVVAVQEDWELVRLSDHCEIDPKRPKPDGNIEVSFLPMADLSVRNFQVKPVQTKKLSETKGYTYFEERDVLLAKITPCFENGKVGLVRTLKNGMGFGSTEYYVFRAKDQILPEYVFFCLLETRFLQEGERSMTGAAGQQRITKSFINNYEISLPDLPTQHRIVAELEAELRVIEGARQLQAAMEARVRAVIGRVWGNPNQTTATA